MISSSMIVAGLSWWQSWLWYSFCQFKFTKENITDSYNYSVWIGYFIAGCFICLTGRIGAVYHIGFPVAARSSFGIWGNLWPVFNRAGMVIQSLLITSRPLSNLCCLGLYLVWRAVVDWRIMHLPHDPINMALIRNPP